MTVTDLLPLVAQYRAGLDAELALLHRLQTLAAQEREVSASSELGPLNDISDARHTVMASLVAIETELQPLRVTLVAEREQLAHVPEFLQVATLHEEAGRLVASIMANDEQSLAALKDAEITRRFAAQAIDKGETTLAAYRRVLTPALAHATLVNRRG